MDLFDDETDDGIDHIDQEEARRIMEEEKDCLILDVRTPDEFAAGHIEGAVCIPLETMDRAIGTKLKDKDQVILVYCRSGSRSTRAALKLVQSGYRNVKEMGGLITWPYGLA